MTSDIIKPQTSGAEFLDNLRARTDHAHKSLEQLPLSSSILSPAVSKTGYSRYLQSMYKVVFSLEQYIFPKLTGILHDISPQKSQWITNDLAHLGEQPVECAANIFENENTSLAFALGIAYVVEGSALGGRFILKNIKLALNFDENSGARYFSGYGGATGSHWKQFLDSFTSYVIDNAAQQDAIAGAEFAFGRIHELFGKEYR